MSEDKRSTEDVFGVSDPRAWKLFRKLTATKNAVAATFHLICAAAGKDREFARNNLNKYTVLFKKLDASGMTVQSQVEGGRFNQWHYSEPGYFGFFYSEAQWNKKLGDFENQLLKIECALDSDWARYVIDALNTSHKAVMRHLTELRKSGE